MRIVIAVQILVTIIVCPKSCALKKAGCKNQVFEEYRQLRGKRFLPNPLKTKELDKMSSSFLTTEKSSFLFLSFKFEYKENGETHTYPFKTGRRFYIDPTKCGNSVRFANHSCEPNMIAKKWMVNNRKEGPKTGVEREGDDTTDTRKIQYLPSNRYRRAIVAQLKIPMDYVFLLL